MSKTHVHTGCKATFSALHEMISFTKKARLMNHLEVTKNVSFCLHLLSSCLLLTCMSSTFFLVIFHFLVSSKFSKMYSSKEEKVHAKQISCEEGTLSSCYGAFVRETATWREQSFLEELPLHFLCTLKALLFPQAEHVKIVGTMPCETLSVASGKLQFLFAFATH